MAFPITSILDDFNRANEGPPPSASWTTRGVGFSGASPSAGLVVNTNAATSSADDFGPATWNADFSADQEVYVTLSTVPQNGYGFQLGLRIQAGNEHYFVAFGRSDPASDTVQIFRVNNLYVWTELNATSGDYIHTGDSYGFEVIGTTLTVYHKPAAGAWGSILSTTDSNISAGGKIGLSSDGSVARLDDFGGGSLTSAPTAAFSGTPTSGTAPLSVDFTDESTLTPTSWLWDFGDDDISTDQNPTHEYAAVGTYTVALTATNNEGNDTETKTDYITVTGAPVAEFSGTPTSGAAPLSVDFTDESTLTPTSWLWDFGDGDSSTDQNPTHVYPYINTYTVTLTATNSAGSDSETKVDYITVTAAVEYGAAEVEDCNVNTGGAAVGLRVADVALARDNLLGSLTIDASAELRAKDNAYTTLVNNGTLNSLAGDRAVYDALGYQARHANDIDEATGIHWSKTELDGTYLAIGAAAGGDLSGTYPEPSVVNDSHTHNETTLTLTDVTTNNASTTQHGFLMKLSGSASQYLGGDGTFHEIPTTLSFFLDDAASDIGGYKTLTATVPAGGETNVSASIATDDTIIEEWAAAADQFDFVSAQVLHTHLHLAKTAGTKTATVYVKVFHRTSGGTETLLGTSAETANLPGSNTEFDLSISVGDTPFTSTDRLVLKIYGNQGGAETDPTIAVYYQGVTNSRLEVGAAPTGGGGGTVTGTGTTGRIVQWSNGPGGVIGDSNLTVSAASPRTLYMGDNFSLNANTLGAPSIVISELSGSRVGILLKTDTNISGDISIVSGKTLIVSNDATVSGTNTGDQTIPAAANPTASVGLTAVNGAAATFMRSDAAPALDVTIAPTWSGVHTFSNTTDSSSTGTGAIVTAGGLGVAKAIYGGSTLTISNSTPTTSTLIASVLAPNMAHGADTGLIIGRANSVNAAGIINYRSDATAANGTLRLGIAGVGVALTIDGNKAVVATSTLQATGGFGCNTKTPQTAYASGGAAPAGGTGTAAGAYDTAAHRDALITLVNNIRAALVANGIMS